MKKKKATPKGGKLLRNKEVRESKRLGRKLRSGDRVYVIAGNEKGKVGTILRHRGKRAIVAGLNFHKKHVKKSQANPSGGVLELEMPIHISNLRHFVAEGKPVKMRTKTNAEGRRQLCYFDEEKQEDVLYRII